MKISFSGAQSSGKTTLLKLCQERFPASDYIFIPEITRILQREGFTINEAGDNMTQLMIIWSHIKNIQEHGEKHMIMDRCILDGAVYTEYLFRHSRVTRETNELAKACLNIYKNSYDIIFYTDPHDVPLVDDGVRSAKQDFRNEIIQIFEAMIQNNWLNIVTLKGSVEERFSTIQKTLKIANV